jgi:threonine synthase
MAEKIYYYSTNGKAGRTTFGEALLKGLAPDKGLYMPERIPVISEDIRQSMSGKTYAEIAFLVARNLLQGEVDDASLKDMVNEAYNFAVPLEKIVDRKYIMRLDQGPTASFKDFAARMMGRLMQYFLKKQNRKMLILTATSGDTGSAIANAFYGLDNIDVVILFPQNEVTARQRKQMTTLRHNIRIVSLDGKFDDCQALVKMAFSDLSLDYLGLSSANSINIGRLLPQSFYYFYAWSKLSLSPGEQAIFAVPSGNFGNMMGGLLAKSMGLPIKRFVIATNENDEVPVYWQTGNYNTVVPSRNCVSSAMNVGHPSNMARVVSLYNGVMDENGNIIREPDIQKMRSEIAAYSITDKETIETVKVLYNQYDILAEPHGAAGWAGLMEYFRHYPADNNSHQLAICLETAHPAKFPEEIQKVLNIDPTLPPSLEGLDHLEESFERIQNDYSHFKEFLVSRY